MYGMFPHRVLCEAWYEYKQSIFFTKHEFPKLYTGVVTGQRKRQNGSIQFLIVPKNTILGCVIFDSKQIKMLQKYKNIIL